MIGAARRVWESLRGSGEYSVTVPPMDGALKPNNALENAEVLLSAEAPDNLVRAGERILFSDGATLCELSRARQLRAQPVASFERPITALAAHGDVTAIGLEGEVVLRGGPADGKRLRSVGNTPLLCPTALAFEGPKSLLVCLGSGKNPPSEWKRDLMEVNRAGSVWRIDTETGNATPLADGLAWPYGIVTTPAGLVVSESWRHRLVRLPDKAGAPEPLLSDLPAYPARIASAAEGGLWLALFAPRRQLVEFVLRERPYCTRMMREIDPAYWAAPALAPMTSFLEPLQGGTLKKLAMVKPWAPSRSYGLVVRLGQNFQPLASCHSRADGSRHGVTSCLEAEGRLLVASAGGGVVLSLDPNAPDEDS